MILNRITDQTGYVTFSFYNQNNNLVDTFDLVKINVSSIQTYINETTENGTGIVTVTTISQNPQLYKSNGILELEPSLWALSATPTTAFTSAAALRTQLLTYFSSKW
jgi:hypothetical protein